MFGRRKDVVGFGYVEDQGSLHAFESSPPQRLDEIGDGRVVMAGKLYYEREHWFTGHKVIGAEIEVRPGIKWNQHVLLARAYDKFRPNRSK